MMWRFAITFVFAGVGTSGPSLIDLLGQDSDSSPTETVQKSSTAVQKAEAAAKATPEDPQVWIALAQAEIVINLLPLTPDTAGLLGRRGLAAISYGTWGPAAPKVTENVHAIGPHPGPRQFRAAF